MTTVKKPVLGYILKGYPRISETFISNEILRLEELGFRIVIFPMRHPRENFCHDSVTKIRASVHYLPTHLGRNFFSLFTANIFLFFHSPRRYIQVLGKAVQRFSRSQKTATFKHLFQAGFLVNNYINKNYQGNIDHLHGHFAHSPTSVTMFASLLSGIPYSFTAHAKDIYTSDSKQLKEKIDKALFVITCTRYNAHYLNEIAENSNTPVHCIYHGIDTSLFTSSAGARSSSSPYTLLTVARLTEKKGLPTIYEALVILRDKGVAFKHILIGDGDDREKILQKIDELGLTQCCRWLGTLPHEEVLTHFRQSDLFLLACQIASDGDRDGIPNVLVESLAMGIPVVSTNVSAIPELIVQEKTGLLVPPSDSRKMAEATQRLLEDRELRESVIIQGQRLVKETFDNRELTAKLAGKFTEAAGHLSSL